MHSGQGGVTEGEELWEDDGEHGLAAAVAVSQRELQQVQQALWEGDGRQQVELYKEENQGVQQKLPVVLQISSTWRGQIIGMHHFHNQFRVILIDCFFR